MPENMTGEDMAAWASLLRSKYGIRWPIAAEDEDEGL